MRYDTPCLKSDWKYAFLISDGYEHPVIDGLEMTAENIWNYDGSREEIVKKLVDYFYSSGLVLWDTMPADAVAKEFLKLVKAQPKSALDRDGSLKNTSRLCLDVCRQFCQKSFYATKTNGTASVYDVYRDKSLLERVLKNRLGWYTTTEPLKLDDGTVLQGEHPYLFDISHKMVVQGCHSAMVSANVSNFRPLVAKCLMSRHCPPRGKVLDLSMGWGARMLAAMSLGLDYCGIDPMTKDELCSMLNALKSDSKVSSAVAKMNSKHEVILECGVSEDAASYAKFPDGLDYAIVCPPYFKLEEYACKDSSTSVYADYSSWLENYWKKTVHNTSSKLKRNAKLTLVMVEEWNGFKLLEDMSNAVIDEGFAVVDELSYKTTRSHLTDKRKSSNKFKSTERARTFAKL